MRVESRRSPAKRGSTSSRLRSVAHHVIAALVVRRPVQVVERGALCIAQVVKDGSRGGNRQRFAAETASIEGQKFEVFENLPSGVVGPEYPAWNRCFERSTARRKFLRMQHFADAQHFERRN